MSEAVIHETVATIDNGSFPAIDPKYFLPADVQNTHAQVGRGIF